MELVVSVINTTNPYFAANIQGGQILGKKLGLPVEVIDSQGSSQTEISKIQAILAKGKKVVMFVNTVASSDAPTIVNAVKAAGGYVTIWWNKPDDFEPWDQGNNFVAFQKHGGVDSGACTADALSKSLGDTGGIIALGGVQDSTTSQTRIFGLQSALKNHPNVKLLEVDYADWDPQKDFAKTQALIAKYGDKIKGIWTADDGMQLGAIEAVDKSPLKGKVKFVSDGLYPPTIDIMQKAGNPIVGETFHRGWAASAIGLYTAYLAAIGEIDPSQLPAEKRDSLFKISCVTPENIDQFLPWDDNVEGWVDDLIANGPWDTEPVPLVAGGPDLAHELRADVRVDGACQFVAPEFDAGEVVVVKAVATDTVGGVTATTLGSAMSVAFSGVTGSGTATVGTLGATDLTGYFTYTVAASTNGTVTFAAGVTSKTITVPLLNDTDVDGDKQFTVFGWRNHGGILVDQQNYWWNSASGVTDGALSLNFGRINDPQVDSDLAEARSNPDPAKRKAAAEDINRTFAKHCYQIPYYWTIWGTPHKSSVQGLGTGQLPDGTAARDGAGFGGQFWVQSLWIQK